MPLRFEARDFRLKLQASSSSANSDLLDGKPGMADRGTLSHFKRGFDVSVAFSAFLILLPMFLILVGMLLVFQGRPIFIRHRRMGLHGISFNCLKFRTMVLDAQAVLERHIAENACARAEWDATHKLRDDPRVTGLGRVLRKSSIDELPQLFNIILGHMSLVGPRPIVEAEIKFYGDKIADYYKVRPGLTGLWQISGRSDLSYASRVNLDAQYVRDRTFAGDLKIIVKTIPAVVKLEGSY